MLRILHTADIHLGARHLGLGDTAPVQRERQAAAFERVVDLALAERVGAVLVAGDLFDSQVQHRRTAERVGSALGRLVAARIPVVITTGCSDPWDAASIHRAHDLSVLAGSPAGSDLVTVLTSERPWVHLQAQGLVVSLFGSAGPLPAAPHVVGIAHAGIAGTVTAVDGAPVLSEAQVAASGLAYLALGHAHRSASGVAGRTTWATPGSPELVRIGVDEPGGVLVVTLGETPAGPTAAVERRTTWRTRHERRELAVDGLATREALLAAARVGVDADLVLDLHLVGSRHAALDLDVSVLEDALRRETLFAVVEDRSIAPPWDAPMPAPQTVLGSFLRTVGARCDELAASAASADPEADAEAMELRETLALGTRLLTGAEVAL